MMGKMVWIGLAAAAVAAHAGAASLVRPGMWQTTSTVVDMDMPDVPPQVAAMMRGHPQVFTHCVTPEEAAKDPRALISNDKSCRFSNYSMAGGKLAATMVCNHGGSAMTITTSGTYTPTSYTAVSRIVDSEKGGIKMTANVSSKLIGACK